MLDPLSHDAVRNRAPLRFRLLGTGIALPERVVTSEQLDATTGKSGGWTRSHFGIDERRHASATETASALGASALRAACAEAEVEPEELDAIIGASAVMEQPIPGLAPLIQARIGLGESGISAFDVNASCLSFLVALDLAIMAINVGRWRRVGIVSSEIATAGLDYSQPHASFIFGDGAAAAIIEAGDRDSLLASSFATFGAGKDLCRLEAGGSRVRLDDIEAFRRAGVFRMNGPRLFKFTAERFEPFLDALLTRAHTDRAGIETIVPHQASSVALKHLAAQFPGKTDATVDIFSQFGNQIAASVPHALHVARSTGKLKPGTKSLLVGSAAGVSLGGAVIAWGAK